jgi:DNA-binding transcriptional regulator YhcF (GntR family)
MNTIHINRSEPISIHTQLMEQLRYHIESGAWEPGKKLPTVRELALALRINYNTVRMAYQELERQDYLVSEQGRGTFVAADIPHKPEGQQETLLDLIDEAIIKAKAKGISPEEFAQTAYTRARLFPLGDPDVRLLFTECNLADLEHYADTIKQGAGVKPETYLVEDLRNKERNFFKRFDLIATTLFHVAEIQVLVGPEQIVLGLMIEPDYLEVLAEIARLPNGARVGLICAEQKGAEAMERVLIGVGATYPRFITAGIDQPDKVEQVFGESDQIYISRLALRQHRGTWPSGKPFRPYVDNLDDGALRLLRRQIAQVHFSKQRKED